MKKLPGLVIGIMVAAAGIAAAQDTTGIISARVVDTQGLPIPGATISVVGMQGPRTVVTAGEGQSVPFSPPSPTRFARNWRDSKPSHARE